MPFAAATAGSFKGAFAAAMVTATAATYNYNYNYNISQTCWIILLNEERS